MEVDILAKAKKVKAVALDVDGVFFTGHVFIGPNGTTFKERSYPDVQGISLLRAAGIHVAFISGGAPVFLEILDAQFNGLPSVKSGAWPALQVLGGKDAQREGKVVLGEQWLSEIGVAWEECAFMGDDISDYEIMKKVGFATAPAQAEEVIKRIAHYVAKRRGGDGAVRDLANLILEAQEFDVTKLALR